MYTTSGRQIILSVHHHNLATGHLPFSPSFAGLSLVKSESFYFEDEDQKNHPETPGVRAAINPIL